MGLIFDSSVVIAAERSKETIEQLIARLVTATGDEEAALSAIGLTELAHGIHRARSAEIRERREQFVQELLRTIPVHPFTMNTALLAARIDGEQQAKGITIPFSDLLIGATALELGFAVATSNVRHFRMIPGLTIIQV